CLRLIQPKYRIRYIFNAALHKGRKRYVRTLYIIRSTKACRYVNLLHLLKEVRQVMLPIAYLLLPCRLALTLLNLSRCPRLCHTFGVHAECLRLVSCPAYNIRYSVLSWLCMLFISYVKLNIRNGSGPPF